MIRDRILSSVVLPAPLRPMMPEDLALGDLEGDVAQRPDLLVLPSAARAASRDALAAAERSSRSVPYALAGARRSGSASTRPADDDRDRHQIVSAKRGSDRRKYASAEHEEDAAATPR